MEQNRLQELAALHAVGALDGEDLLEFEKLLAGSDDTLRQEISAFAQVTAALAQAYPSPQGPSPELKTRLLQKIEVSAQAKGQNKSKPSPELNEPQGPGFKVIWNQDQTGWQDLPVAGASIKMLSFDAAKDNAVVLGKLAPGTRYPAHKHLDAEEIYVLSGDLHIGTDVLHAGDFHHADAGTEHGENWSEGGCVILAILSGRTLQAQFASMT